MADKKISALTASTTPLAGTEVLPIVQAGSTVKVSIADVTAGRAVSASSLTASTGSFIVSTSGQGITTGSAIPLGLGTNNSVTAVTIDTSGNIGVGGAPSAGYRVHAINSGGLNLIASTSSDASGVTTYMQANGSTSGVFGTLSNHPQIFVANNTERMRITATGDVSVATGNVVIGTAAKGIDFSANGGDVLSQYDEGTYTPVFTASSSNPTVTYSRQRGKYVRVGNVVTISVDLIWDAISGGSGDVQLSLPFAGESSVGASGAGPIAVLDGVTFAASRTFCNVQPQASVLYATLPQAGSGVSTSNTTVAQLSASGRLVLSCTYLV